MTTCRDVLTDAFAKLGVVAFGGEATADEIDGGLTAMKNVILNLHAARGPMQDMDVNADYIASENQRVRVEAGAEVVVTLPNSVLTWDGSCHDFGSVPVRATCAFGQIGAADGIQSRPPRDGARIEIVGTTQALYFYRSDLNAWIAVTPLSIDGPTPLNTLYDSALAALVAERLCDPMNVAPSAVLAKQIARGNAALILQPTVVHHATLLTYL